ncbi:hypothetical protein HP532_11325, partial [Pseudomonas sp. CrR25]|nr:hypothetical protein [Pseudomonas sp. CrR25]
MQQAEPNCSPRLLAALNHKVLHHLGMDFSGPRTADLLRRLHLLALDQQVTDFERWLQELAFADWDTALVQSLIPAFTVGETYFRRDAEAFEWLAKHHLGPLLQRRRREGRYHLRLWSAGCCTGEEPYGLLFLLDQLLGKERERWTLELVASDLNTCFLARAQQGLYGSNALRSSDEAFRQHYFQAEGRLWRVRPAWRERIRFVQHNLADGALTPPVQDADLILCRNVLMYLAPPRALAALRRLFGCLSDDGVLLLSAVEAGLATQAGFAGTWAGCNYALTGKETLPAPDLANLALHAPTQAPLQPTAAAPAFEAPFQPRAVPAAPRPAAGDHNAAGAAVAVDTHRAVREGYWQQARHAQGSGQHALAREALLGYLRCAGLSRAQQHQGCLALARNCADQQHVDDARDWLRRALDLDASASAAYWLEALLAQQDGDDQAALLALQKAL